MRLIVPVRLAALLTGVALLLAAPAARADGDPASDFLLIQDTFFPFQYRVSPNLQTAVNQTVARAKAAGFPLKVAIISAATDLGADPGLFGTPQKYATFLDQEISFNKKVMLLVVMPQGFGVASTGLPSVLAGIKVPPGTGADHLARAALPAIVALAANAGHPITLPQVGAASGSGGGTPALLTFGAPLGLILIVGLVLIFRGRGTPAALPEPDDDAEDDDEPVKP